MAGLLIVILSVLGVAACARADGSLDYGPLVLIGLFVGGFVVLRRLARWDSAQQEKRRQVLATGLEVRGNLVSLTVAASSPSGKVPSSTVRLIVNLEGGGEQKIKEVVPTYQLANIRPGMEVWLRHPEGRLEDAVVDWDRSIH